jgi:hypothetical protein
MIFLGEYNYPLMNIIAISCFVNNRMFTQQEQFLFFNDTLGITGLKLNIPMAEIEASLTREPCSDIKYSIQYYKA